MTKFIVSAHSLIESQSLVWRTGIILTKDNTWAEIIEIRKDRKITIRISGQHTRELMAIIEQKFDEIHQTFPGIKKEMYVPCNCSTCRCKPEPGFYPLDKLKDFFINRRPIQCYESGDMVDVMALFGEVWNIPQNLVENHKTGKIDQEDLFIELSEIMPWFKSFFREVFEKGNLNIIFKKEEKMRDKYIVNGPSGAVGPDAKAEGNTIQQIQISGQNVDMKMLIEELNKLRNDLSKQASTDEEYEDIKKIDEAKTEAEAGHGGKVVRILKSLGKWTGKAVTDIGTKVIASIISHKMGY
jgi:internalin A